MHTVCYSYFFRLARRCISAPKKPSLSLSFSFSLSLSFSFLSPMRWSQPVLSRDSGLSGVGVRESIGGGASVNAGGDINEFFLDPETNEFDCEEGSLPRVLPRPGMSTA